MKTKKKEGRKDGETGKVKESEKEQVKNRYLWENIDGGKRG